MRRHETKCTSRKFDCPICNDNEQLQAYEILQHFKIEHGENYLKKCSINVKVSDLKTTDIFLYLKGNFMIFIFLEYDNVKEYLLLNFSYIGARNQAEIEQKFIVKIDDECDLRTSPKTVCLPLQSVKYKSDKIFSSYEINCIQIDHNIEIEFEHFRATHLNRMLVETQTQNRYFYCNQMYEMYRRTGRVLGN